MIRRGESNEGDPRKAADSKRGLALDALPELQGSFYLKWAGRKGFGVFMGDSTFKSYATLATYGGVVVCYKEANDTKQSYSLFDLKLADFRFRRGDKEAIVDGTSIWAGDGKFLNHSCCPMITTKAALSFYTNPDMDVEAENKHSTRSGDLKILCFKLSYVFVVTISDH